ncbi:MAG: hypothetical protein QG603_34 [Patescibacteria group bacterium]|nr:hypothetical protein [Patescibacteria group bacterium]MDQ5970257.1 hypothetical protein [Patescibacteria group bacterium]
MSTKKTKMIRLHDFNVDQDEIEMLFKILSLHGPLLITCVDYGKTLALFKEVPDDPSLSFDEWFWGGHHHGGCSG